MQTSGTFYAENNISDDKLDMKISIYEQSQLLPT